MSRFSIYLRAVLGLSCAAYGIFCPGFAQANPMTEFSDLKELKGITADLGIPNDNEERWFPPDSNYAKLFLERKSIKLVISWLGTLSKQYSVEPSSEYHLRSLIKLQAIYRSRRNEDSPIEMSLLVPHPRSMEARTLNLIPEFTDLETATKKSSNSEHLDISGFPADLGIDTDKAICRLVVPLPRLSMLYLETHECTNRKKLIDFCDTIDIVRLAGKIEK